MARYSNDPRWITAKFTSKCSKCGQSIQTGESIFYYPLGKKVLCKGDDCSGQASREFDACAFDEAQETGNW